MQALDTVLEEIAVHPIDEQELIIELAQRRLADLKRQFLAVRIAEANDALSKGAVKTGTAEDLFREAGV